MIDMIDSYCILSLGWYSLMKKVNKKYYEIMHQADIAVGRKEVVSLLKKAAKIRSINEEISVA